jgi:hypothetical protein
VALLCCCACSANLNGRPSQAVSLQAASEKILILQALRELRTEIERVRSQSPSGIERWLSWLEEEANKWTPKTVNEGRALRESFELMRRSIRGVANDEAKVRRLLTLIAEDLQDKAEYCRAEGLGRERQIQVVTKREGITEVKGLEVFYLPKFLEADVTAKPQRFEGFSSPVKGSLTAGRYWIWAKESGVGGRNGERRDSRVNQAVPLGPIEVLAP